MSPIHPGSRRLTVSTSSVMGLGIHQEGVEEEEIVIRDRQKPESAFGDRDSSLLLILCGSLNG